MNRAPRRVADRIGPCQRSDGGHELVRRVLIDIYIYAPALGVKIKAPRWQWESGVKWINWIASRDGVW